MRQTLRGPTRVPVAVAVVVLCGLMVLITAVPGAASVSTRRAGVGLAPAGPVDATPSNSSSPPPAGASLAAWSSVTTYVEPPARYLAGFSYDAAAGYDLLFGGMNGPNSPLGDTWTFHEDLWQPVTTSGPPARFGANLVYDPAAGSVILFGGGNATSYLGDTWQFQDGSWTQLHPTDAPSPRELASATYDPATSQIVLFGGWNGDTDLNDTWTFSDGQWTNITGAVGPSPRDGSGMAYDAADGYVVLFGGENSSSVQNFNDTWTFSGGMWANVSATAGGPSARTPAESMAAAGATTGAGVLLFGGEDTYSGTYLNDTWTFVQGRWAEESSSLAPLPRVGASLVWDGALGDDLLVDGQGAITYNDSYVWNVTAWDATPEPTIPQARYDPSLAYDSAAQEDVLFGGLDTNTSLVDTDTWTYADHKWTVSDSGSTPPGERWGASMAYDPSDDAIVLFGGYDEQTQQPYPGTWTYQNGAWSELPTAAAPPARYGASMVYDSSDGYLVLFGGIGSGDTLLDDTWTFTGVGWSNDSPSTSPSPRAFAAMSDDNASSEVVLFGGCDQLNRTLGCVGVAGDTWAFVNGNWVQRFPASSPPGRAYGAMAYDSVDGYAVLYGGASPQQVYSDTWEFSKGSWFNITPSHGPGPLQGIGFAYDPVEKEFLLMGGVEGFGGAATSGMTWEFVGGPGMTPPPAHNLDWWLFADHGPLSIPIFGAISYITILSGISAILYALVRWVPRKSK